MHKQEPRYARVGGHWVGGSGISGWWVLPPDVEPPPRRAGDQARRFVSILYMPAAYRAAALKGLRAGEFFGRLLAALSKALDRRQTRHDTQVIEGPWLRGISRLRPVRLRPKGRTLSFRSGGPQRWR